MPAAPFGTLMSPPALRTHTVHTRRVRAHDAVRFSTGCTPCLHAPCGMPTGRLAVRSCSDFWCMYTLAPS